MSRPHILVVEDERSIQTVLQRYLESADFRVTVVENGPDAIEQAAQIAPSLVILDLNLPGMDGAEVAARLQATSDVPIMMLTARSEESDRVAGLRLGADDYVTKPFSPREVVARVEAILRRAGRGGPPPTALRFDHLTIDPERHEATGGGGPLSLTPTEFKVLVALAREAGRVMTRNQLIDRVWGEDFYGTDRVVDVYVGQVRRKLEQATGEAMIETIRGVGYKFVANPR